MVKERREKFGDQREMVEERWEVVGDRMEMVGSGEDGMEDTMEEAETFLLIKRKIERKIVVVLPSISISVSQSLSLVMSTPGISRRSERLSLCLKASSASLSLSEL